MSVRPAAPRLVGRGAPPTSTGHTVKAPVIDVSEIFIKQFDSVLLPRMRAGRVIDLRRSFLPPDIRPDTGPAPTQVAYPTTKPHTLPPSLKRRVGSWSVSLVIILAIIVGVPKGLAWALDTPFPMAAITSGSMWPVLKKGDLVFIQGVARGDINVGDIIVFQNPANGTFTIHRVASLGAETLTTKGDANFEQDTPVPYSTVVGRTLRLFSGQPFHMPYLGSITVFASNLRANE